MKLDLDELERALRTPGGCPECGRSSDNEATLALIARIRELEGTVAGAASIIESEVVAQSQHDDYHDDLDWKSAQAMRAIVAKGAVLP